MTDYLLWLDTETTGLDLYGTTVLEVAWTLTGTDLVQVTPLRRSMCAIRATKEALATELFGSGFGSGWTAVRQRMGSDRPVIPLYAADQANQGKLQPWSEPIDQFVADMHEKSGLRHEWLSTDVQDILTEAVDLDAELLADLAQVRFNPDEDTVAIAGAGVGHFDLPLLRNLQLSVVRSLHYRPADVSSAISVLGLKPIKTNDALFQLVRRVAGLPEEGEQLLALDVDDSVTDLQVLKSMTGPDSAVIHSFTDHRAASDVAFSLILARCLRYVMSNLVSV